MRGVHSEWMCVPLTHTSIESCADVCDPASIVCEATIEHELQIDFVNMFLLYCKLYILRILLRKVGWP